MANHSRKTVNHRMLKVALIILLGAVCLQLSAQAPGKRILYLTDDGLDDIDNTFNRSLMDDVFGEDGWQELHYTGLDTAGLFSDSTCMIFLEGSDDVSDEFVAFYDEYRVNVEQFVFNGGHIIINFYSFPSFDYFLGFDSIWRSNQYALNWAGNYISTNFSIISGPSYPISNPINFSPYLGFANSIGTYYGSNYDTIIIGVDELTICLLSKKFGMGEFFSSQFITTDEYYSEEHLNLRKNILWHLAPCLHSAHDMGVFNVLSPTDDCNLSASETLSVLVHNFGYLDQDTFQISFSVDDGPIVTESFSQPVTAYLSDTLVITTPVDLSECGTHTIQVWTTLAGDTIPQNDTLVFTITNVCATYSTTGFPAEVCAYGGVIAPMPEVGAGSWVGDGIIDAYAGTFDPALVGEGNSAQIAYTWATAIAYAVTPIPFEPAVFTDPTPLSLLYDDDVDTLILPFDFIYFSKSYDTIYPASNGYLSFGAPHDTWYINIPDPGGINNLLAFAGYDLNPAAGGAIYYSIEGEAPNRVFQLRYENVPLHFPSTENIDVTAKLYETEHTIDIIVHNLPEVDAFGFDQGISNIDGSLFYVTNPIDWFLGATDTAFRFTPVLCSRTVTDTIFVVGNHPTDALGADTLFCAGEFITIMPDTTALSYVWNTGDTTAYLVVGEEGMFTLDMQYLPGCFLSDTVFVEAIDSLQLELTTTPVTPGETDGTATVSVIAGGLPPFSYIWNTGETTSTIENLIPGYYSVTVTDSAGCSNTDSIAVTLENSIQNGVYNDLVMVYPNPADAFIVIQLLNPNYHPAEIRLFNIDGKIVYENSMVNNQLEIDVRNFAKGSYVMQVQTQQKIVYLHLLLN